MNYYLGQGYTQELAEQQAARWVAAPGTSEHNLGLAADIVSADWYQNNDDLTGAFEETPEFAWLSQHCVEYGFVLRYPADKTTLTGVEYEPWHYRYVGVEDAQKIMAAGLCLEEYLGVAEKEESSSSSAQSASSADVKQESSSASSAAASSSSAAASSASASSAASSSGSAAPESAAPSDAVSREGEKKA